MEQGVVIRVYDPATHQIHQAINKEFVDELVSVGETVARKVKETLDMISSEGPEGKDHYNQFFHIRVWLEDKFLRLTRDIRGLKQELKLCTPRNNLLVSNYFHNEATPSHIILRFLNQIFLSSGSIINERSYNPSLQQIFPDIGISMPKFRKLSTPRLPDFSNDSLIHVYLIDWSSGGPGKLTDRTVVPSKLMSRQHNFRELGLQPLNQEHYKDIKEWFIELLDNKIIVVFDIEEDLSKILDTWEPYITGLNINRKISPGLAKRILLKGLV